MKTALIRSAAVSDPGNVRANNEDRVYADDERGIYIVIDGVGGEAAGERAAAIAEEEVVGRLVRSTGVIEDRIREGIALAGKRIFDYARRNPQFTGMSCVLTVAVVSDGDVVIGHVGDTRLYKVRRGTLEKITRDHAPVGAREDSGEISEREAMQHPRRNEIFRDVGSEEHSPYDPDFIDIERVAFEPDSALLLCSDGLTDQVPSSEIAQTVVRYAGEPQVIAEQLVRRANDAGGKDNVSVVYVEGSAVAPASERADAKTDSRSLLRQWRSRLLPLAAAVLGGMVLGGAAGILFYRAWTPPVPAQPRVLVVAPKLADAYATIGMALEEARPGDVIEVREGAYREQIEMKDGVRVVAVPAGGAILEPKADAAQPGAAIVFRNVKSAAVSGLRVTIAPDSGISVGVLVDGSDAEVSALDVQGASYAGIVIRGESPALIRGNTIHENAGAGIAVEGSAAPQILSNLVHDNGNRPEAPHAGVEVKAGAHPVIAGNVFADNNKHILWEGPPEHATEALKQNLVHTSSRPRQRAERTAQGSK